MNAIEGYCQEKMTMLFATDNIIEYLCLFKLSNPCTEHISHFGVLECIFNGEIVCMLMILLSERAAQHKTRGTLYIIMVEFFTVIKPKAITNLGNLHELQLSDEAWHEVKTPSTSINSISSKWLLAQSSQLQCSKEGGIGLAQVLNGDPQLSLYCSPEIALLPLGTVSNSAEGTLQVPPSCRTGTTLMDNNFDEQLCPDLEPAWTGDEFHDQDEFIRTPVLDYVYSFPNVCLGN
eukprot:Gb_11005 [translate_table: standard]